MTNVLFLLLMAQMPWAQADHFSNGGSPGLIFKIDLFD